MEMLVRDWHFVTYVRDVANAINVDKLITYVSKAVCRQ